MPNLDSLMGSPKSKPALERLGRDLRSARLRRGMAVSDLAVRAGASVSTIGRLEKGETGVALGTLADVLVALGLVSRLADLVEIKTDDLGLALSEQQLPKRGRSVTGRLSRQKSDSKTAKPAEDVVDPDGAAF